MTTYERKRNEKGHIDIYPWGKEIMLAEDNTANKTVG